MKKIRFHYYRYLVGIVKLLSVTIILISLLLNDIYSSFIFHPLSIICFLLFYLYIIVFFIYSYTYTWIFQDEGFQKEINLPFWSKEGLIRWNDVYKIKKIDILGTPYLVFYYHTGGKERKILFPPFLNHSDEFLNLVFKRINHIIISKNAINYLQYRK